MITIESAFKRYNANSQDNSVGDCVKRALAYAYGRDYNDISRELNKIKNEIGSFAYNQTRTWTKFLQDHGAKKLGKEYTGMTEDEFCEKYPNGLFVLLTGSEKKGYSTHMVTILNGDIIDSWNSSNYIVYEAWSLEGMSTETYDVTWSDIEEEMNSFIDDYLASVKPKYDNWFTAWREDGYQVNPQTYRMKFVLQTGHDLPSYSDYYPDRKHQKRIVVKINPRMTLEQNLESLKPKLKQSVYDWLYPYQKDMRDCQAIRTFENENIKDPVDKKELLKLPAWIRPYVKYFWWNKHGYAGYWNNFELRFKALPDDPYVKDGERPDTIRIETETWKDMKDQLDAYKKDFSRDGYDF